ncbi:MAG: HRDC domain-containing protein [Myxococcales bacterium]|nr:HRDC domain-containing protein [Myxococcales bacterium]
MTAGTQHGNGNRGAAPAARWVADADALAALVGEIATVGEVALDLEFNSEERYLPDLALVQLGWQRGGDVAIALCDPLAVDLAPLFEVLAKKPLLAHAARQDLQLLAHRFAFVPETLWDTQVAAAFCGLGDQVGYGKLVAVLCGVTIDKGDQWTNWLRRPLKPSQLAYAAGDVRYLFDVAEALRQRAGERVAWAAEDSMRMCGVAYAHATAPAELAWRDITGARTLDAHQLAVLRRLAMWRLEVAARLNTPINRVASEKTLIELARKPPRDGRGFSERLHGAIATERSEEILDAISDGFADAKAGQVPTWPDEPALPAAAAAPPSERGGRGGGGGGMVAAPPHVRLWEELALGLVGLISHQTAIAPRVLATRADIESFIRIASALPRGERVVPIMGEMYGHVLCRGWRRDVIAAPLLAFYRGEVGIAIDDVAPSNPAGLRYF